MDAIRGGNKIACRANRKILDCMKRQQKQIFESYEAFSFAERSTERCTLALSIGNVPLILQVDKQIFESYEVFCFAERSTERFPLALSIGDVLLILQAATTPALPVSIDTRTDSRRR